MALRSAKTAILLPFIYVHHQKVSTQLTVVTAKQTFQLITVINIRRTKCRRRRAQSTIRESNAAEPRDLIESD